MDPETVAKWISKATAGTIARGVLWAIAGVSAWLTLKGFVVPEADQSKVLEIVQAVLAIGLPILASRWSKKKDVKLLAIEPPR